MARVDEEDIPVCNACWQQIPCGERVTIALKFRDRRPAGMDLDSVASLLHQMLSDSFGRYFERHMGSDFRGN